MDAPESEKYFKTRMEQTNVLYEYQNKTTFSNDQVAYAHNPIHPHFQVISIQISSLPRALRGSAVCKMTIKSHFNIYSTRVALTNF